MSRKNVNRRNEVMFERLRIIARLTEPGLKKDECAQIRQKICEEYDISEKTVRRWVAAYMAAGGPKGLLPKKRESKKPRVISDSVLARAIELRKENPRRSVERIIEILVGEKRVEEGEVKRSTLQAAFEENNCAAKDMRVRDVERTARFMKSTRNELWMGDIKDGPMLVIDGELTKTHISVLIDDFSRHVVYAKIYPTNGSEIVEDTFRNAIELCGIPEAVYFDNGRQYKNSWMKHCCEFLGIKLLYCKPYSPQSKGVVERFNRTLDDGFLKENAVNPAKTLEELNRRFDAWLALKYEDKVHSTTKEKPSDRFANDPTPLHFPNPDILNLAFMHIEMRKVDKAGEISFKAVSYYVGKEYAFTNVMIYYHPDNDEYLTLVTSDGEFKRIYRTHWDSFVDPAPIAEPEPPKTPSHYLDDLVEKREQQLGQSAGSSVSEDTKEPPEENPAPAGKPGRSKTAIRFSEYDEE
ncbi:MAG: DDE-type integrase/transposase/recombinase [Clostridia bacterium]|nr:DDE-type integrase/transposase/recombinase [Clostridia bacterium]